MDGWMDERFLGLFHTCQPFRMLTCMSEPYNPYNFYEILMHTRNDIFIVYSSTICSWNNTISQILHKVHI